MPERALISLSAFTAAAGTLSNDEALRLNIFRTGLATTDWERFQVRFVDAFRSEDAIARDKCKAMNAYLQAVQHEYGDEMASIANFVISQTSPPQGNAGSPLNAFSLVVANETLTEHGAAHWQKIEAAIGRATSIRQNAPEAAQETPSYQGLVSGIIDTLIVHAELLGFNDFDLAGWGHNTLEASQNPANHSLPYAIETALRGAATEKRNSEGLVTLTPLTNEHIQEVAGATIRNVLAKELLQTLYNTQVTDAALQAQLQAPIFPNIKASAQTLEGIRQLVLHRTDLLSRPVAKDVMQTEIQTLLKCLNFGALDIKNLSESLDQANTEHAKEEAFIQFSTRFTTMFEASQLPDADFAQFVTLSLACIDETLNPAALPALAANENKTEFLRKTLSHYYRQHFDVAQTLDNLLQKSPEKDKLQTLFEAPAQKESIEHWALVSRGTAPQTVTQMNAQCSTLLTTVQAGKQAFTDFFQAYAAIPKTSGNDATSRTLTRHYVSLITELKELHATGGGNVFEDLQTFVRLSYALYAASDDKAPPVNDERKQILPDDMKKIMKLLPDHAEMITFFNEDVIAARVLSYVQKAFDQEAWISAAAFER